MEEQYPQQPLPPQQPAIPPQQSFYGKRNWLKWGLVLVLVVAFSSGTTYLVLNSQSPKQPPPQITQTTPTPTPSDETANWKTYKSDKLSIEFKYPPQFSYTESIAGIQNTLYFKDKDREFTLEKLISEGGVPPYLETNKTQVFNGLIWKVSTQSKDAKYCDAGMCSSLAPSYYIYKNNSMYSLIYRPEDLRETIEKILTSVNFLNTIIVDLQHIQYTQALDVQTLDVSGKIRLYLPKDAVAPPVGFSLHTGGRITFNEAVYVLNPNAANIGLCSAEDQAKYGCSFKDEQFGFIKDLRIWSDQNGVIGINPRNIQGGNINIRGLLISKEVPNRIFTQEEVNIWKAILLQMEVIK